MYIPERSTYTGPVTSSEALLACLPEQYDVASLTASPSAHMLTVKTCNSPTLLRRNLHSFRPSMPDYMQAVVVDDSKDPCSQQENEELAAANGAAYFPVSGERSIVAGFSRFLHETESGEARDVLSSYLNRVATSYYDSPAEGSWGGVAGAQNVAHLCNVMLFGEQGIAPGDWLSTFVDDDIELPPNGPDIFRMQKIYHNLGSVSVIASNYLHHSANPIRLTRAAAEYLAEFGDEMADSTIAGAIDCILQRVPTHGLRKASESDCLYTTPELTLAFPLGNYSLSGDQAFKLPIPIVGMDDVGYCELLQLFEGARQLGVARVPDFTHRRVVRKNGGDAIGRLATHYTNPQKEVDHDPFHALARAYAVNVEGVAAENVEGLDVRLHERKTGMGGEIDYLLDILGLLISNRRFADHSEALTLLRNNLSLATNVLSGKLISDLDPEFAGQLLVSMRTLQPRLIEAAYRFGAEGGLEQYRSAAN